MLRKQLVQCVHKTDGRTLNASPFHKHPGVTPSETCVHTVLDSNGKRFVVIVGGHFIKVSCELRMRGWQYLETCYAVSALQFLVSTLVSTTAAGDERCSSKKQVCKLWMESLRRLYLLFLSSCRYIASS